jgi:hypothetical protein
VVANAEVGDPGDVVLELQAGVRLEAVDQPGHAADDAEGDQDREVGRHAVRHGQDRDHRGADERQQDQDAGVDHAACARK